MSMVPFFAESDRFIYAGEGSKQQVRTTTALDFEL